MITAEEAAQGVLALRVCRYFPSEEIQRAQIAAIIIEMVNTKAELDWLVITQVKMGEWKGLGELRGLFCARFNPRDGMYLESTTPGFTMRDIEGENNAKQQEETRLQIEGWKREKLLAEAQEAKQIKAPE